MKYWLMRSEPEVFSLQHLKQAKHQTTCWDGVRNYQARNFLRDQILVDHRVLFYHSRCQPLAIVGTAKVIRSGYADPSQFDSKSRYFDATATRERPRWFAVDIAFEQEFPRPVTREQLLQEPFLATMLLLQPGSRLSVQPVMEEHFRYIVQLGGGRAL